MRRRRTVTLTTKELKQARARRRRQQKPQKFAYLTIENNILARFARAFFTFWHFENALVLSTTWNDLFCSCVDDVSIWWQMFNFVFLCPKRWFQINFRIVRTHFSSIMTLNNWKMIAETRSYIFRWRLRSTTRPQRRHHKICILNCQKQKFCTPFTCFFLIPCISFKFSANLRRDHFSSFTENVNTQVQIWIFFSSVDNAPLNSVPG